MGNGHFNGSCERRISSSSFATSYVSCGDSGKKSSVSRVQKCLERERANEKNAALKKKQTNLRLKTKKELLQKQKEQQEMSDLRLGDIEPNSGQSIHLDDEALIGLRKNSADASGSGGLLRSS